MYIRSNCILLYQSLLAFFTKVGKLICIGEKIFKIGKCKNMVARAQRVKQSFEQSFGMLLQSTPLRSINRRFKKFFLASTRQPSVVLFSFFLENFCSLIV